jgi:gamma-glutamylcyclotransferase (GGCT)/AIG2-like uncharacterized protein YtfP
MDKNALYFAYSSDINEKSLARWCGKNGYDFPLKGKVANAWLPDHELIFNYRERENRGRVSNIRRRFGQAMPGVLFEVKPDGWKAIEAKKLVPRCYRPYETIVLTEDGREREAVAYRVFADRIAGTFYPPRLDYASALREGLLSHGLDDRMLMAVTAGREAPWTVDHIFVYGTLMKGFARHHLLEAWAHPMTRQEARAPGILFDSRKGHPCLVPAKNEGQIVKGELYRIRDNRQAFEMLDIVEDFRGYGDARSEFRRALVRAETAGGQSTLAWAYFYNRPTARLDVIESGDWKNRPFLA